MKLTRASSYALHAVVYMASRKEDIPIASHHIAEEQKIPSRFLLKVLKPLVNTRVLLSIKGPSGGYKLARPADQITLLEVIEAADGGPLQGYAPEPREDKKKGPIPPAARALNNKLDNICKHTAEMVREHLKSIRISDLIPTRGKRG
jgi:Rrf2 family protein